MEEIKINRDGETFTGTILKHIMTISEWANGSYELNLVMWDKPINNRRMYYDFAFWDNNTRVRGQQLSDYEIRNFAHAYEIIKDLEFDI